MGVRELLLPLLVIVFPFVYFGPKWFCRGGDGPSSTIQSLRSIRDVFRPKFGGEGEGDLEMECGGVNGAIGENESASDEIGSSRMLGDIEVPLLRSDTEDGFPIASKAFILDCNNVEGAIMAEEGECFVMVGTYARRHAGTSIALVQCHNRSRSFKFKTLLLIKQTDSGHGVFHCY